MHVILGIDAAWSANKPSGVAVVVGSRGRWRCSDTKLRCASFLSLAEGQSIDWTAKTMQVGKFKATDLLAAASKLTRGKVDLVAIDIPLAKVSIFGRREADNAISRRFGGAMKCGTHSPSSGRHPVLDGRIRRDFESNGFMLATETRRPPNDRWLIEVHPALLRLCSAPCRLEYEVGKARSYWHGQAAPRHLKNLLEVWQQIWNALEVEVEMIGLPEPKSLPLFKGASLKRYEEALDALVCAWVRSCFLEGRVDAPYGDDTAAI
jgi:predicted RNase H-like nuclease